MLPLRACRQRRARSRKPIGESDAAQNSLRRIGPVIVTLAVGSHSAKAQGSGDESGDARSAGRRRKKGNGPRSSTDDKKRSDPRNQNERASSGDRRGSDSRPTQGPLAVPTRINEAFTCPTGNGCQYSATIRGSVKSARGGNGEEPRYTPNLTVNAWVTCQNNTELRVTDSSLRETTMTRSQLEQAIEMRGSLLVERRATLRLPARLQPSAMGLPASGCRISARPAPRWGRSPTTKTAPGTHGDDSKHRTVGESCAQRGATTMRARNQREARAVRSGNDHAERRDIGRDRKDLLQTTASRPRLRAPSGKSSFRRPDFWRARGHRSSGVNASKFSGSAADAYTSPPGVRVARREEA